MVDAYVNATLLLGVDSTVLGGLYLDQLNLGCLGSSIDDINVTSKALGVESWTCVCEETITSNKGGSPFVCHSIISKSACQSAPSSLVTTDEKKSASFIPSISSLSSNLIGQYFDMDSVLQHVMGEAFTNVQKLIIAETLKLLEKEDSTTPTVSEEQLVGLPTIPTIPSLNSLLGTLNCSAHVPDSHGSPPDSYVNFLSEDGLWPKVC